MNKSNLFSISLLSIPVNDWEEKKKKILSSSDDIKLYGEVNTNYDPYRKDLINISSIFSEEIDTISKEIDRKIVVSGSWVEKAEKKMHHTIHNHGQIGLSAICYVEFDSNEHEPVIFIAPFNDIFNGQLIEASSKQMKEGLILLFPSFLLHYTNPNKSDKIRTTLSFNLEIF
jgi:hypothetical protein